MFNVRMEPLLEEAGNLRELPKQILNGEDVLQRAAGILSGLSVPDDIIIRIRKEQTHMNQSAVLAFQLGSTLENIWHQYHRSEREITDFCEHSQLIWRREPTSYHYLAWVAEILNEGEKG